MADDDFVRRVKDANNIVDVVGDYVPLRRRGGRFWGLSPFKHEKTPSFSVQESNQLWYCFATAQGGDVIQFLQAHLNLDFRGALELLARRAGIPVPERAFAGRTGGGSDGLRSQLLELHEKVAHWWHGLLLRDPAAEGARNYLSKRGISQDTARAFRVGYAPEGWDTTLAWARAEGFNDKLLLESGLVIAPEDKPGRLYGRFRGRLMFPICTEAGSVVAFSGRVLDPDAKDAKYINSPETRLFSKGRLLFGLDKNKRDLVTAGQAILCEGQIDLVTCHQAGVRTLLAPQGTAFTAHQARVLKRIVDEVVICFDSDEAGRKAVFRAGPLLLAEGLAVRVLHLPDAGDGKKHDPDSFVRAEGPDAFLALAAGAPEFWPHVITELTARHDTTSDRGRTGFKRDLFELLANVDGQHYDTALLLAAGRLQTSHLLLREELRRGLPKRRFSDGDEPRADTPVTPLKPDPKVDALLRFCLQHPERMPDLHRVLHPEWLTGLDGHDLLLQLLDAPGHDDWPGLDEWILSRPVPERSYLQATRLHTPPNVAPDTILADCLATVELAWLDTRLAAVRASLHQSADAPTALQEMLQLQQRQLAVRRQLDRSPGTT